jgi:hypothetical protein
MLSRLIRSDPNQAPESRGARGSSVCPEETVLSLVIAFESVQEGEEDFIRGMGDLVLLVQTCEGGGVDCADARVRRGTV